MGGGFFLRWSGLSFSYSVFGYNSNSHYNPLIVSLLLLAFVISKASSIFSMDNRPIICHVTFSMRHL